MPLKTEDILPRWFPTHEEGKQQVWSSDLKFSGLEKPHKDSIYLSAKQAR